MKKIKSTGALVLAVCGLNTLEGQEWDKREYHLFNPTPASQLRDLSADRPDKTESPYTVDAGRYQVELDLATYTYDTYLPGGMRGRVESYRVVPVNLKAGLWHNVDFQLILEPYQHVRIKDSATGGTETRDGFGDITTRLKVNFWGNDGGPTAFGMMPFVKFPTNQDGLGNDSVEGGVIFPLALALPYGWGAGLQTEIDWVRNEADSDYDTEWINSIALGHDIYGSLAGYVEFFSVVSSAGDSEWIGMIGGGLTYLVNENLQLDAGVNFGLTRAAEDINPFAGMTVRF